MFGELCAIANRILLADLTSGEPLSALWQILAILAVAGIVIVVGLAIIEPGPLVKRRPFPKEERSRKSKSDGVRRTSMDQARTPASLDENSDRDDDE